MSRRFGGTEATRRAQSLRLIAARSQLSDALPRGERRRHRLSERLVAAGVRALTLLAGVQVVAGLGAWAWASASSSQVPRLPIVLTALAFSAVGAVLAQAGRRDPRASDLAGFFLAVAAAAAQPFLSAGDSLASGLRWFLPETFLPFFFWRFTRSFPRVLRLDPLAPVVDIAIRASAVVGAALFALNGWARSPYGEGVELAGVMGSLLRGPANAYWILVAGLCVPAPLVAWLRSRFAPESERARVRRFLAGLGIGFVPLFAEVVVEVLSSDFRELMSQPEMRRFGGVLLYGLLLSVPVTTSHAVLGRNLLGSSPVAARGSRIILGHRAPLLLTAVCLFLLTMIAVRGSDRPLRETFSHPAVPWLMVAGFLPLAVSRLLLSRRSLPRSLGGGATQSDTVAGALIDLGNEVRSTRTREELAGIVARRAADLVGSSSSRVFLLDGSGGFYIASDRSVRPLSVVSALGRMLEASPDPVLLGADEPESLFALLPEDERLWVADAETELAVPLPTSLGTCVGFLALGPHPGEERFRSAEIEALAALASSAALALERLAAAPAGAAGGSADGDEPAGECRTCGAVARRATGRCRCGGRVVEAVIPYVLAGKFRLERILGRGGMGVVYAAEDLTLGRRVALKTLPELGATALLRLRGEARSMARVIDPHLALIYGAETWRGVPVLVVEHMPGGTLADRLTAGPLSPAETVALGLDLAAALEAMHGEGLLHRDLKPSNIAFTADGRPKLLDFGLAHLVHEGLPRGAASASVSPRGPSDRLEGDRLTATEGLVGTPAYLSPEALAGAQPSPALDLWALHLCLWECLAGHLPKDCHPSERLRGRRRASPLPDVRTARPGCPEEFAALLRTGLDLDPRRRFLTARAVRESLSRLQSGREP